MSDIVLFITGLLVSFLCLGGFLIHGVVNNKVADAGDTPEKGNAAPDDPRQKR